MARTLKGNLTGRAAHGRDELDETPITRTNQDVRIGDKKKQLLAVMGYVNFMAFYTKTSFINDILEKQLDDKINEMKPE